MIRNYYIEKLEAGEKVTIKEAGNSMAPVIKSRQPVEVTPVDDISTLKKGDIVYCKVNGYTYCHRIYAVDKEKGCLIGNIRGKINGWSRTIYGKVTRIL